MRFVFYEVERRFLTLLCKIAAGIAKKLKLCWMVSLLNSLLKARGDVLGRESVYCMNRTKRWLKKTELCITAFHQYEKECK